MAQQVIDIGANADDGTGDTLRISGIKINANFDELYARSSVGSHIRFENNVIKSTLSNADIDINPSGTGAVVFPGVTIDDNNIKASRTNDDLKIIPNGSGSTVIGGVGFGGTSISAVDSSTININENLVVDGTLNTGALTLSTALSLSGTLEVPSGLTTLSSLTVTGSSTLAGTTTIDNLAFNDNSISSTSNADIIFTPGGTGAVVFPAMTLNDHHITGTRSNENIVISAGGTGDVVMGSFRINGTTIDSADSTVININENLTVDGTLTAGVPTFQGVLNLGSTFAVPDALTTLSTLTVTGASSFVGTTTIDNLQFNDNIIATSSNADLLLTPGGTGVVNVSNLTIDSSMSFSDNIIKVTRSNDNLQLSGGSGSGQVQTLSEVTTGEITTVGDVDITGNKTIIGQLDVEGIQIKDNSLSTDESNSNLLLSGNGTGNVKINDVDINAGAIDNIVIGASEAAAGTFTTITLSPADGAILQSEGVKITDNQITSRRSNENLELFANGSGKVILNGISLPNADGGTGQVLKTNGSGTLSFLTSPILLGVTDIQDNNVTISFSSETVIDHVTSVVAHDRIESGTAVQNSFATSKYDSAWYLGVERDDISDEFRVVKHSVVHNNSDAFVSNSILAQTGTNNHITTTADVNSGLVRLQGTGNSPENSMTAYRIGLGDDDSTGYSGEDEAAVVINTDIDSANEVIDSFAHGSFRGAKYYISVNNASKTELSNLEAIVVHNGSAAYISVYNVVNTGSNDLITLTAAINGSNVEISAAGLETNLRVHAYRILLADNEADRSSTNINVIGNVTLPSATTTFSTSEIDHVTAVGQHDRIESGTAVQDSWTTSKYDSAWYLAVNRDESSNEFEVTKHSVVHNNSDAFITTSIDAKTGTNNHIITTADINSGSVRLLGTGSSPENSVGFYRIGLGDDDSTGYAGEDEAAVVINTDVDSASEVIDSWAHASFRGAKYYVSVNNASKTELMNCEVSVVHNGTDAFVSTYNIVNTGSNDLCTFTAAINGSNLELSAAGLETNLRVHAYRIRLADNEADRSSTNINVIGNVTVSSATTTLDTFSTGTYQAAQYVIVSHNASEGHSAICEAAVVSDGTNAFVSQDGLTSTKGTDQILLTVGHAGSTTTLSATSTSGGSTTVNAYRVNITRGATTTPTTTLDTFSTGTYKAAHYVIVGHNASESASSICEAAVVSDGTNAFITKYGTTSSDNTDQITLTVGHAGSTTTLSATSTLDGTTTVNAYRVNLARDAGASTAVATLDSVSASTFRSAKYNVQVVDATGGNYELFEANVTHDGSNAYLSTFGNVGSSTGLITVTADIDSGNLRLRGQINNLNEHEVTVVRRVMQV